MAKVINPSEEGISILRWRLLPKSHIFVDPKGRLVEDAPPYIAYSPQAKALADQGIISIEGYTVPGKGVATPSTETPSVDARVSSERRDKRARKQGR
jgi:hypothetical protein